MLRAQKWKGAAVNLNNKLKLKNNNIPTALCCLKSIALNKLFQLKWVLQIEEVSIWLLNTFFWIFEFKLFL